MKTRISIGLVIAIAISVLLLSCCAKTDDPAGSGDNSNADVVFLGASITEVFYYPDWDQFFPDRNYNKVIIYEADKSPGFSEVASYNPSIVTFKECGAYFDPDGNTDMATMQQNMIAMANYIQSIGATPVPGTTFPIVPGMYDCTQAQLDDIIEFNVWVRSWCATNGWVCMDYHLWIADGNGALPVAYTDGDGLHINMDGYALIAPNVKATLDSVPAK